MDYFPPFVVYGAHKMQLDKIKTHGRLYKLLLEAITDNRFDFSKALDLQNLNQEKIPTLT
jgi:hypothetical protein